MSIKRILIPTDFSETAQLAVAHGAKMSHLFNAKIFLLHVEESRAYAGVPAEPGMVFLEPMHENSEQKLYKIAGDIIMNYDIELASLTSMGKPANGIITAVKENNIDMVIMGTHGASGFEEYFVGSNTHRVVNLAPCPVLSVQKFAKKVGFSTIIMPIDNDLHSRQKVNNVIELATSYKSTVHILGLLETDADGIDEKKFEIKMDSVEDAIKHAGIPFVRKLVKGDNLAVEAMKYSEEAGGDLIVIMTGHESNLTGMFLGSFAKQIVNHSKIPVLSIKPEETLLEEFDLTGGTGVII